MQQRSANSGDKAIGKLIRMRRIEQKISQSDLGGKLGVSFQQVQKYEKGVNRVGAARLQQIAAALDVPVTYFFNGDLQSLGRDADLAAFMTSPDGAAIAKAVMSIPAGKPRRTLRDLIEFIAKGKVRVGADDGAEPARKVA